MKEVQTHGDESLDDLGHVCMVNGGEGSGGGRK